MPYRIAIKRRFWFGFVNFQVLTHKTEILGAGSRLVMKLVDGTLISIPAIHKRVAIVYPGYIDQPLE